MIPVSTISDALANALLAGADAAKSAPEFREAVTTAANARLAKHEDKPEIFTEYANAALALQMIHQADSAEAHVLSRPSPFDEQRAQQSNERIER